MGAVRVQIDQLTVNPGEQLQVLLDCWRVVLTFQARQFDGWRVSGAPLDSTGAGLTAGSRISMEFGRLVIGPNVEPANLNTTLYINDDGTASFALSVTVAREYWDPELPDLQRQSRSVAARRAITVHRARANR